MPEIVDSPVFDSVRTPKELVELVNSSFTGMAADNALKPHIGIPLKVSGRILEVESFFGGALVTIEDGDDVLLVLRFGEYWLNRLATLTKGDRIKVRGEIHKASPSGVMLHKCKLL